MENIPSSPCSKMSPACSQAPEGQTSEPSSKRSSASRLNPADVKRDGRKATRNPKRIPTSVSAMIPF